VIHECWSGNDNVQANPYHKVHAITQGSDEGSLGNLIESAKLVEIDAVVDVLHGMVAEGT
jgi:hypothetical protein